MVSVEEEALALGLDEEDVEAYRMWRERSNPNAISTATIQSGGDTLNKAPDPNALPPFLKKKLKKKKVKDEAESPAEHVPWYKKANKLFKHEEGATPFVPPQSDTNDELPAFLKKKQKKKEEREAAEALSPRSQPSPPMSPAEIEALPPLLRKKQKKKEKEKERLRASDEGVPARVRADSTLQI